MTFGGGCAGAGACALPAGSARSWRDFRLAFMSFALVLVVTLLAGLARADSIPDSLSQVGSWRVGAYTRGQTATFDHGALYRVQGDGFAIAVGVTAKGIWSLALEAPDWGLTPREAYTTSIVVGTAASYTFTGRAVSVRAMSLDAAPELFSQLKSGVQFSATANRHHYSLSLDGIEAAVARVRDCVRQYSAQGGSPASAQPTVSAPPAKTTEAAKGQPAPSALVMSIQILLTRLGYNPGTPNGIIGVWTNVAIAAFQKSQGDQGDGLPSEAVRAKLEKVVAERSAGAAVQPSAETEAPTERRAVSSGTGFYISQNTIITNFHVINGCAEMRIRKNGAEQGSARVVAVSQSDDLAALRSEVTSKAFLRLRAGASIKPAEAVLVFGYPLSGALSSAGNTTLGNVTALTGLRDDSRYLQISAAVQPGNSGGPVLDDSGRLMGVVVSKLNALTTARITGDIPQNVNFAIKVSTVVSFLETNKPAFPI